MCLKAKCDNCHKTTWWGCGNHIQNVMSNIPHDEWCSCEPCVEKDGNKYPPMGNRNS